MWCFYGRYSKYGRNLSNLVFLDQSCHVFPSWESQVHHLFLCLLWFFFLLIRFVSAAAVWCCIVSSGNLSLLLLRGSALVSSVCDAVLWTASESWTPAKKTYFATQFFGQISSPVWFAAQLMAGSCDVISQITVAAAWFRHFVMTSHKLTWK